MSQTLYIPSHKNWGLFGGVSDGSPSAGDSDHELSWLTDGRPGFPLRLIGGTGTIAVTPPAPTSPATVPAVTLIALCNHLLDAGLVVGVSGDVSGTITVPAYPRNGVPFNAWNMVEVASPPVDVANVILAITGNSDDIVIGEVVIGEALALEDSLRLEDVSASVRRFLNTQNNPLSGIPPYSERAESRLISGSQYYDQTDLDAILDWFRSEDASPYQVPSLLIPNSDDPTDARLVTFAAEPTWTQLRAGDDPLYLVQLTFNEFPRTRW